MTITLFDALPAGQILADPLLAMAADVLDDIEKVRIANENRLRSLRDVFGLDERDPDVARLGAMVDVFKKVEHDASLNLRRAMRRHPLGPFAAANRGIGDQQLARLLASIGDPYWNFPHGRPRTVSQLWAYCGLHTLSVGQVGHVTHTPLADGEPDFPTGHSSSGDRDSCSGGESDSAGGDQSGIDTHATHVAARRRKGQRANWSNSAKMRAWLVVSSCYRQIDRECKRDNGIGIHAQGCRCSRYRRAVDVRRSHTALTHPEWTPQHSLNDGMRIASKVLLRDLWREARTVHLARALELAGEVRVA